MKTATKGLFSHRLVWTAIALSLATGGYLFLRANPDQNPVSVPEEVTIAYSATPDAVIAEVAQVQGYYRQEGLVATPRLHSYGKAALTEVLAGEADFATVAETPFMFAVLNGEKISIIATIQTASKDSAIIARKDRGILTPSDLKGRKLATTLGTVSEFFMDAFLAANEISRQDLQVVDLEPEELAEALASGEVDAVSAFSPYAILVKKRLGDRGIAFVDENLYTKTFNIVARQEFIRANPGKVEKLLRALVKAEEFVHRNPAEAQRIVADFTGMEIALVREMWADTSVHVILDQRLILVLEDESEWAMRSGLAAKREIPNYLDFIYFDGLDSAKPEVVRILR